MLKIVDQQAFDGRVRHTWLSCVDCRRRRDSVPLSAQIRDLTGGGPPKSTAGEIPAGGISSLLPVLYEVAERVGKTPAQVRDHYSSL